MTKFLAIISIAFLYSCGEPPPPQEEKGVFHGCIDDLASCEFVANRSSSSILVYWIRQRECSYDYGACAPANTKNCKEYCAITHNPSACESTCLRKTKTSTASSD